MQQHKLKGCKQRWIKVYSQLAVLWQGGHVGGQNNKNNFWGICMTKKFPAEENASFLSTNMAAMMSDANQQWPCDFNGLFSIPFLSG